MMLRSRNSNSHNIIRQDKGLSKDDSHLDKRGVKTALKDVENIKGEPRPKRQALCDLSQAISNVLIDSSKKVAVDRNSTRGRQNSAGSDENKLPTVIEVDLTQSAEKSSAPALNDPCPGYDYDAENANDPLNVPQFACDIFRYSAWRERYFEVDEYIQNHATISKEARAVLADWMVEMQETFELNHETLYLAVKLTDIYLSKTHNVSRADMQLLACTAFFIASKFDERSPPLIDDFLYISEESFKREDMITMEMKMLEVVGFDLGAPLSYSYLRRFAKVSKTDMSTLTLARYVLESSLMFYELVTAQESRLAAGAFLLALRMVNPDAVWTPVLHKYSGISPSEVEPMMEMMNHMLHMRASMYQKLATVVTKYSHEVFFHAACVPMLRDKFGPNEPVDPACFRH